MTSVTSSYLVGSLVLIEDVTIVVNGANNAVISAGTYYLRDSALALSLLDVILAAVAPFMTTPAVFVAEDRKIRVTAGVSFTWAIPTELQEVLGFGASIPSTTSATATNISTLLWVPGWPETTIGHPVGTTGYPSKQRVQTASSSGLTTRTTIRGSSRIVASFAWLFVQRERVWTVDGGLPGEFRRFLDEVLEPGLAWKLYSKMSNDEASSAPVAWTTGFGPSVLSDDYEPMWWSRAVQNVDSHSNLQLRAHVISEIS